MLTHLRRVDFSTTTVWIGLFPKAGCLFFYYYYYYVVFFFLLEITVVNANNVDPDQTPRSAASDLGLHCLPMSLFFKKYCPFLLVS